MSENSLIIFLRYPEPGKVKTRLSKGIGQDNAAKLYRSFVETILYRISVVPEYTEKTTGNVIKSRDALYKTLLFFTPDDKCDAIKSWLGNQHTFSSQSGRDLGERIFNAFRTTAASGAKKAIIIGSDAPMVDRSLVFNAFAKLDKADVVIGPSNDGGYYILGLSFATKSVDKYEGLFMDIKWDTGAVFGQTTEKLNEHGFVYTLLPESYDIDNVEDLELMKQHLLQIKDLEMVGLQDISELLDELNW